MCLTIWTPPYIYAGLYEEEVAREEQRREDREALMARDYKLAVAAMQNAGSRAWTTQLEAARERNQRNLARLEGAMGLDQTATGSLMAQYQAAQLAARSSRYKTENWFVRTFGI